MSAESVSPPNRIKYVYAVQKLTEALQCLCTHKGDVRERLVFAHLIFHPLQERDFPEELRPKWRKMMQKLTKFGPYLNADGKPLRGSVENTMRRVRGSTGSEIANELWEIYWLITENSQYD